MTLSSPSLSPNSGSSNIYPQPPVLESIRVEVKNLTQDLNINDLEQIKQFIGKFDEMKQARLGDSFFRWLRTTVQNRLLDFLHSSTIGILEEFVPALEEYTEVVKARASHQNDENFTSREWNALSRWYSVQTRIKALFEIAHEKHSVGFAEFTLLQALVDPSVWSKLVLFTLEWVLATTAAVLVSLSGGHWFIVLTAFVAAIYVCGQVSIRLQESCMCQQATTHFAERITEINTVAQQLEMQMQEQECLKLLHKKYDQAKNQFTHFGYAVKMKHLTLAKNSFKVEQTLPSLLYLGPYTTVYVKSNEQWVCCWNDTEETIALDCAPAKVSNDSISIEPPWCKALNVRPTADTKTCLRAYHQLAIQNHPDKNPENDTTEAFQALGSIKPVFEKFLSKKFVELKETLKMGSTSADTDLETTEEQNKATTRRLITYPNYPNLNTV